MTAGGILLTGGSSRRMGRDKASLVLDGAGGLTLARRAAVTLSTACSPCVEVGPGHTDLFSLLEVPPGGGPLAALVAGGHALRIEHGYLGPVVLLACDMPRVTPELVALLAGAGGSESESVVPEAGGRLQPLCARYSASALETAQGLVDEGVRSMHGLLERIPYRRLAEVDWGDMAPPDAFADLDTPAALGFLERAAPESGPGRSKNPPGDLP